MDISNTCHALWWSVPCMHATRALGVLKPSITAKCLSTTSHNRWMKTAYIRYLNLMDIKNNIIIYIYINAQLNAFYPRFLN